MEEAWLLLLSESLSLQEVAALGLMNSRFLNYYVHCLQVLPTAGHYELHWMPPE